MNPFAPTLLTAAHAIADKHLAPCVTSDDWHRRSDLAADIVRLVTTTNLQSLAALRAVRTFVADEREARVGSLTIGGRLDTLDEADAPLVRECDEVLAQIDGVVGTEVAAVEQGAGMGL
jgi:hypothetical protein